VQEAAHALHVGQQDQSWGEITKLTQLPELKELLLVGNTISDGFSKKEVFPVTRWWTRCLRR